MLIENVFKNISIFIFYDLYTHLFTSFFKAEESETQHNLDPCPSWLHEICRSLRPWAVGHCGSRLAVGRWPVWLNLNQFLLSFGRLRLSSWQTLGDRDDCDVEIIHDDDSILGSTIGSVLWNSFTCVFSLKNIKMQPYWCCVFYVPKSCWPSLIHKVVPVYNGFGQCNVL